MVYIAREAQSQETISLPNSIFVPLRISFAAAAFSLSLSSLCGFPFRTWGVNAKREMDPIFFAKYHIYFLWMYFVIWWTWLWTSRCMFFNEGFFSL